jgi:hypothetical protein
MTNIIISPGDVFGTSNPQGLGRPICLAESLKSQDGKAEYGHTGILTNIHADTIEALWSIKSQNFFEAYKGQKAIIARWTGMNPGAYQRGYEAIKPQIGRWYPVHRLILHFLGLAKFVHFLNIPVCSELTAMFLIKAGAPTIAGDNCWGITPDNLVDEWRISKHFDIVFEGIV